MTPLPQQMPVGIHHVRAEDIQANEMFLAGKANFHFAIAPVARPAVLQRLFEAGQEGVHSSRIFFSAAFRSTGTSFK
jgi:hypothetical protein